MNHKTFMKIVNALHGYNISEKPTEEAMAKERKYWIDDYTDLAMKIAEVIEREKEDVQLTYTPRYTLSDKPITTLCNNNI